MNNPDCYFLFAFDSTHAALAAQKCLKQQVHFVVMPTLREITASCGISLRVAQEEMELALAELAKTQLPFRLYQVRNVNGKLQATEYRQ